MAGGGKRRPNHSNENRNNQNNNRNAKTDGGGGGSSRRRSKSIRNSLFIEGGLLEDWSPSHSGPSANSFTFFFAEKDQNS